MKKIQKTFSSEIKASTSDHIKMDLDNYRRTEVNIQNNSFTKGESLSAPLSQVFTLATFMLSPFIVNGQCLVSSRAIDINRDGVADMSIYTTFRTNGYSGAIRSVSQIRARGINPADNVKFFGTQFFPRSCYYNSCVFPTPDGAISGIMSGNVAVLYERITSCTSSFITVKNTNTYTISNNVYTTCTTYVDFATYCQPTIINGNFELGTPGTLAFQFNNQEFHFIELTIGSNPLVSKVDGAIAQPCDNGCQDTLELTCNEVFPIDSYKAENRIETNDIVDVSQMVELTAGAEIEMLPGFEVISGGEFLAEIDPNCQ